MRVEKRLGIRKEGKLPLANDVVHPAREGIAGRYVGGDSEKGYPLRRRGIKEYCSILHRATRGVRGGGGIRS